MKKFKPLYTFASLYKQFVLFTKNWRRKSTGELVNKDTLELTGDVKCFENIVDKDGHKRFIEGDIEISPFEGVTQTYGKWSLSGSHFMIVLAVTCADGTGIPYNGIIASITNIPEWILSKIVSLGGNIVSNASFYLFDSSGSTTQNLPMFLRKITSGSDTFLRLTSGSLTLNADRSGRFQFDLLIDNAESE